MSVRIEGIRSSGLGSRTVTAWAQKTARILHRQKDDMAIVFVSRLKIRRLNRKYRGLDRPTDVLSFPSEAKGDMGDIFIAPTVAKKKAVKAQMKYRDYAILLIVHSILHLGGYDHHTKKEAAKMEKVEKRMMKYLV